MPSLPNELWWKILTDAISLESNLATVKPSSEHLHPFFPGSFSGFDDVRFYPSQLAVWKHNSMVAHNFVQVNRLWRGIAERFLYSAFYVEEEWRVQRFIDTVKLNPNLAKRLRTLIFMRRLGPGGVKEACLGPLVEQVLGLCHGIVAIVVGPHLLSGPLPLFQSPDSSQSLLLLSAIRSPNKELLTFMRNFNNYASLQVLELSIDVTNSRTPPTFPEHITLPSLHTLVLGYLDPFVINIVRRWELPSLKEFFISRWYTSISTPLLALIQRSYDRLEFFSACTDLLHDDEFYNIVQAIPFHLTNVTLDNSTSAYSSPPMHPATKPFFGSLITLGIGHFAGIKPEDKPAWVLFFSDSTYMPHLRSVLTDATTSLVAICVHFSLPLLGVLRSFEEVLEDRGVAFKGVTDDGSTFVPIKLLEWDTLEVSMSLLGNGSILISSPASKCSPWELRAVST